VRLAQDHCQRIVQLVGDARQQGAHRRQLLGLHEPLRALLNDLLQRSILALDVEVEDSRVQEVLDAQQHLEPVERLGQEILGARLQRALLRLGGGIRCEDQDREKHILGNLELLYDRDPV